MGEIAEKSPAIYKAIAGVIADVGSVGKDKVNKQQGFKFRSIDDVYNALHPALAKNKVFIVPDILEQTREIVETKSGTKMTMVICKIRYTFFAEDGSHIESIIIGEALDTGDKATNKAMAIAYKYACFQVFCIPTEEMVDPDAESPEIKAGSAKTAQDKVSASKKKEEPSVVKKEPDSKKDQESDPAEKITTAMLNTIRSEQKRTGVTDYLLLSQKCVKAKRVEDMNVIEFKAIMEIFKQCPDNAYGGEK